MHILFSPQSLADPRRYWGRKMTRFFLAVAAAVLVFGRLSVARSAAETVAVASGLTVAGQADEGSDRPGPETCGQNRDDLSSWYFLFMNNLQKKENGFFVYTIAFEYFFCLQKAFLLTYEDFYINHSRNPVISFSLHGHFH